MGILFYPVLAGATHGEMASCAAGMAAADAQSRGVQVGGPASGELLSWIPPSGLELMFESVGASVDLVNWPAGTWQCGIHLTAGVSPLIWTSVTICRIAVDGSVVATVGSNSAGTGCNVGSTLTYSITGIATTGAVTDSFYVVFNFAATGWPPATTGTLKLDQPVVTPFTSLGEPIPIPPVRRAHTYYRTRPVARSALLKRRYRVNMTVYVVDQGQMGIYATDSILLSEAAALTATLTTSDAAGLAEAMTPRPTDTDAATLAESSYVLTIVAVDAAVQTDTVAINPTLTATDAFTLTERVLLVVPVTATDAGTLAESYKLTVLAVDTGTLVDATNTITETGLNATDAAVLTEAYILTFPSITDSATLTEGTSAILQAVTDAATLAETAVVFPTATDAFTFAEVGAAFTTADSASLSEAVTLTVTAADAAALTEAAVVAPSGSTDGGTLAEVAAVFPVATDAATLAESGYTLQPMATDAALLTEATVSTLSATDAAALTEASTLALSGTDAATLAEATLGPVRDTDAATLGEGSSIPQPQATDAAALAEAYTLKVILADTDTAGLTDLGTITSGLPAEIIGVPGST